MKHKSLRIVALSVPVILTVILLALGLQSLAAAGSQPPRLSSPSLDRLASLAVQPLDPLAAQGVMLSGWFTVIWGDGEPGSGLTTEDYFVTQDNGETTQLYLGDHLSWPDGGVLALNNKHVIVQGTWRALAQQAGPASLQVGAIRLDTLAQAKMSAPAPLATGSVTKRYITILCKFADIPDEPNPVSYFQQMYTSTYPGLDHYWREQSYDAVTLQGSQSVSKWYTLPQPLSYYTTTGNSPDTTKLAQDCTAVADADVYFPDYAGINMMFNGYFSPAKGGSKCLTLDGVNDCWPITWLPTWAYHRLAALEHEMGHSFGMPHSSGNYGQTYDNMWDVMSDDGSTCSVVDPTYGCLGYHTISFHKDLVGWMPAGKKYVVAAGQQATVTLEQLAQPQTGNYLMAQVPIKGSPNWFYTVEARRKAGYDVQVPGQAVIIHEVDRNRSGSPPAHVIDIDNNGNTGDAGAMWLPGETFSDTLHGITITVVSSGTTGFTVRIENQSFPTLYYVAPTGTDASNTCTNQAAPCATVQHAVDVAEDSGEIHVATGAYTGVSARAGITQAVYTSKTVIIRGGYATTDWTTSDPLARPTTLDAQGAGRVLYIAQSSRPTIEGLRLTGGDASMAGGSSGGNGGGIFVDLWAAPTISNCTIVNNSAESGGGVFLRQSSAILKRNTVISNSASFGGGIMMVFSDADVLDGNRVLSNSADWEGGGLDLYSSNPQAANNVIADNQVGAYGSGSGVHMSGSAPKLLHTTIARNTGGDGSGIYLQDSTVALSNTILVGHMVGVKLGASDIATLTATLWGTGTWANQSDWSGGSVHTGTINLHSAPAFVAPDAGDYHITQASAAVNQGVNAGVEADIDGQPRPSGSAPDLGADEWYSSVNHAPNMPASPSPADNETGVYVYHLLSWQGGDPDNDRITYTVSLGSSNPPPVVAHVNSAEFLPSPLMTGTHYYWKITATDGISVTVGPVWEFETRSDVTGGRIYLPMVRKD